MQNTPSANPVRPTRFCTHCTRELPLDQFPFRVIGRPARRGRCRQCQAGYMRTYRACRRARSLDQLTAALAREASPSKLESLVAIRLRQFGGLDGFARQWRAQYDAAVQQAPGSRRVLNVHVAMARMLQAAQANRPKTDYSLMSDEDLKREHERALLEYIGSNPEIAVWAAVKSGWTVIPATSNCDQ